MAWQGEEGWMKVGRGSWLDWNGMGGYSLEGVLGVINFSLLSSLFVGTLC